MHTVQQLHNSLPELVNNIRRSRALAKSAVIATGPKAGRTLAVVTAGARGEDEHLVHMFNCPPGRLMDQFPHENNVLEMRPEKWCRLEKVIKLFLAGADEDTLLAAEAGR